MRASPYLRQKPFPHLQVRRHTWRDFEWTRVLTFVLIHLACLGIIWVGVSWTAFAAFISLYFLRMFAITGFYHRYFSHRTFKTTRVAQFIFGILGASALQCGPIWWAAHHRYHHQCADTPADVHSPTQHGFFQSHVGWFMSRTTFPADTTLVKDLLKYPELRLIDRFDVIVPSILATLLFSGGMMLKHHRPELGTDGWQMLVWAFFCSSVAVFHATYTINSLSHLFGHRRYDTPDESRNNGGLAMITLGEGWHNNHHHFPGSARQGFFWWELDVTFYCLTLLSWSRVIWDLKSVPADVKLRVKVIDA